MFWEWNSQETDYNNIGFDRMEEIEEYTDYNFPFNEKLTVLKDEVTEEAKEDIKTVSNYAKIGALIFSTPFLVAGAFFLYLNYKTIKGVLKWN